MRGRIVSINTSRGGPLKTSVFEGRVTEYGVEGDVQNDLRYHGGPNRAVSLYSFEAIRTLQAEGHPIRPGTVGENLTISGLDWPSVVPGRELTIGEVRLAVTAYAPPCEKIKASFLNREFTRISQKVHPGWSRLYARVIAGGVIRPGEEVVVHEQAKNPAEAGSHTSANRVSESPRKADEQAARSRE